MRKLKVMTIVGTRPEIIRLSRTINKLDQFCDHVLIHTGQNYDYELNEIFFSDLGIRKPDAFMGAAGETAAQTIGQIIIAADEMIARYQPEALLLLGDTNSALSAISAKRRKVPIFHMEAGNRCFDFRVPEEINRRIVDHISDINLTYSEIAREYLLREGLPSDQVIKTGSPMREVIEFYRKHIDESEILGTLGLKKNQYFVLSAHREENVDSPTQLQKLFDLLDHLVRTHGQPILVSTHPRTKKRIVDAGLVADPLVRFEKPFGFTDYVKLQVEARAVLSDSGTITEESSILNFPALNLREVHERPEGFEQAAVMMVGMSIERVEQGLAILADQPRGDSRGLHLVHDYAPDNVSDKVVRIIQSYTDFVNRRVWRKS
ncbi:UDP-N-acetyl glucosamine 2-epimerase [Alcaligenaceae bacterium LF4-65]|uniref:UDP-N-acetyl glucosamine 2-epimerase n=1 Tax=Zwartia hollandica TaxID=324606 RepID=A0A953N9E9_9BURK|nr:UDP-N-acetyl glucosamine 2-epimerase [Zwartia hollandica]MBZ1350108.1 UDP-N-acetyl glucosamine 2-epimerase [Zwartia hollandica]